MDTHFAVLPLDVIDTVVSQLPDEARRPSIFLRLPHPRTGIASLFLAHESDERDRKGVSKILEVQAVEPPNARSWFMGDEVISDGKMLVMTPVDPLFLLIPILEAIKQSDGGVGNFRPADDIFEDAARNIMETGGTQDTTSTVGVEDVMKFAAFVCTKKAMRRLCDVKEITPEIVVYRYSREKLVEELRKKVARLSTPRIAEMSRCMVRSLAKDALMEDKNEALLEQGRTRLGCELVGQYLPQEVREALFGSYDLAELDAHVRGLLVTPEQNKSRSQGDPEAKKRKNGRGSQGVERLKKANVTGMSKLSTFFHKKAG